MYKRILVYLLLIPAVLLVSSCSDVLSPANENINELEDMYTDASYAEGFLSNAYNLMPGNGWTFTDVATDNAVTNDNSNAFRQMATGQWTADNYPLNEWSDSRAGIQFVNIMIANADSVQWAEDEATRELFSQRMKGEAYGLRAYFMYHLLRNHAGWTGGDQGGQLLGVPIVTEPQDKDSDFQQPRNTFEECMQQIYSDVEKARELLPVDYGNVSDPSQLPEGYGDDENDLGRFNRVFGNDGRQRMSGRIAMAIKAKAALLAASPAYSAGTNTSWEDAANYAGELLALNNGVAGLAPEGATWYDNASQISNLGSGSNPPEMIWRGNLDGGSTGLEQQHFPPTLYGNGWMNPTQDLVDAFPMQNGYPIGHPNSNYDSSNPYQDRVPLLEEYILVNGGTAGVNSTQITTAADGNTNDALNAVETSTRTGYYMKKLLRQDVNLDPTSTNSQVHYYPRIRYTEIYLAYAEAANEAWGPDGMGNFSFSARGVIEAIRARQGITNDQYLQNEVASTEDMRELIRNVRRIELAFENFRFWDLRRWNMELAESADGVSISNGNHNIITVEPRDYQPYQRFGPVPYNEVLKFGLEQNYGW
ncbi:RagB/SusD family nutrient uptake outer membrane protein [Aliifodinibius sp. S!AR15-10]|uniref:RagB/SusD family nutrient uptake outer membrane protein n=1 Tax=Aliifodinibius sp. S!AR15-10 TaxID=2950437 RepID=UPI0028589871|nr:RagB/SusD family nutrient uptake outer membrane protein [Aliifodinibius sp. S!AR15-10]MDR8393360.1 RagB/SusD family nutrient uptake outer membrane protein [Aliifodinibius sp. S!AR15-10]